METRNIRLTLEKAKEWFKLGGDLKEIALQAFKRAELRDVHISLLRDSFIIEAEGKKLRVSYKEFCGNHEAAMKFCKENGGGDETVENIHIISKYLDEINKELKARGKTTIKGWLWTNMPSWRNEDFAFVVFAFNGDVANEYRYSYSNARAVSAL